MSTVPVTLPRTPADATIGSRYRGCLLGGAVGDALGAPVEFMRRADILREFGRGGIQEFEPDYGRLGAITDDTQMTLFTAEGVLRAHVAERLGGERQPREAMALAYQRWLFTQGETHPLQAHCLDGWLLQQRDLHAQRAPGTTCLSGLRSMTAPADLARNDSKGCGGVMRVAPIGLFLTSLDGPGAGPPTASFTAAFDFGCVAAAITHGHPTGQLASGFLAALVMRIVQGTGLADGIREVTELLRSRARHQETLTAVELATRLAAEGVDPVTAIEQLGGGWIAEEALAIGLYCALTAPDLRSGVIAAVNHDGDSDSTGSIAGQLLGAIHGEAAIPASWLAPLELRDVIAAVADDLATVAGWNLDDEAERDFYVGRYPPPQKGARLE